MALSLSAQQKKQQHSIIIYPKCYLQQKIFLLLKVCFNFELGEMHTDHTQLTLHEEVAKVSDKGAIETTGYV
jgi:hypothetical protein